MATQLFKDAGFHVEARRKLGDSLITSGYVLGFGIADFDQDHLAAHLVSNFTDTTVNDPSEQLFINVGLIVRRPPT